MVETRTTKRDDPRAKLREQRANRLKMIKGDRPTTIKVFAANEDMQRVLRHSSGVRFRDDIGEGVEWPNDSFTHRRIADGSVSTEQGRAGNKQPSAEEQETMNARQIAAARKPKKEERPQQAGSNKQKPQAPPAV